MALGKVFITVTKNNSSWFNTLPTKIKVVAVMSGRYLQNCFTNKQDLYRTKLEY